MGLSWLGGTQTELINRQIADSSPQGAQQTAFIQAMISEFEGSAAYKFMGVAQRYYENDPDIRDKKRTVIAKDMENNAVLKESKVLTNNKLQHNFMKKLTRQKIGYMLGKPFTLTAVLEDDAEAKAFFKAMSEYFGMDFYKFIKNVARDSIVKGLGWVQIYYNEAGYLKMRRCAPEEIIPIWADADHTILDALIRCYEVDQYTGGDKKTIKYVEYYTHEGVYYYVVDDTGHLVLNPDIEVNPSSHFYLKNEDVESEEKQKAVNWQEIPFIPFKYDPDEQSLLSRIKSLVDDYDKKTSGIADTIDDHPNSITVVKNYDGASKEEFVQNKNEYRTIFVQGDGDAKALETPLNVSDLDKHLERLPQDIYEFGQGVNTADKDIRDTSGVALRFIYADLDMDCVDWGGEVKWSLMKLIWFIQQDIIFKTGVDYTKVKYDIVFNTDVIINESETVLNCMNSVGLVSGRTIAANHPWTLDADKEMSALKEETEQTYELEAEYGSNPNSASGGASSAAKK
jgi:SPP1 family phage portal protein